MRAFDPERTRQELTPARVNGRALFTAGTLAWLCALAALGVIHLTGHDVNGQGAAMCVVGIGFGLVGLRWSQRMRRLEDEKMSA